MRLLLESTFRLYSQLSRHDCGGDLVVYNIELSNVWSFILVGKYSLVGMG